MFDPSFFGAIPEVGAYDDRVRDTSGPGSGLRGLVVDWGGVLTGSLDGAMSAWAAQDEIEYEHFRDVIRSWVSGPVAGSGMAGAPGNGAGPVREGIAGDGLVSDLGGGRTVPGGAVADLEQADSAPAGSSPVHRLERGEISGRDFEDALAIELRRRGSSVPAEGLLDRMLAGLQSLDDDMVRLVRRAKEHGIRTALLSNSWGDHYPERLWDGLFDAFVISGQVGMRKPEPEIFRFACAQLGLAPSACVMVDDLPHNVTGAVAVGMVAVRHVTYADTLLELEALFEVPLR